MQKLSKLLVDSAQNISTEQRCLDAMFGGARNEFDYHYSGFAQGLLTDLLTKTGFKYIELFQAYADDESTHKICGVDVSLNFVASNSETSSIQSLIPSKPIKVTNELTMYREAADERLKHILMLKHVGDEREKVIQYLSSQLALAQQNGQSDGTLKSKIKSKFGR